MNELDREHEKHKQEAMKEQQQEQQEEETNGHRSKPEESRADKNDQSSVQLSPTSERRLLEEEQEEEMIRYAIEMSLKQQHITDISNEISHGENAPQIPPLVVVGREETDIINYDNRRQRFAPNHPVMNPDMNHSNYYSRGGHVITPHTEIQLTPREREIIARERMREREHAMRLATFDQSQRMRQQQVIYGPQTNTNIRHSSVVTPDSTVAAAISPRNNMQQSYSSNLNPGPPYEYDDVILDDFSVPPQHEDPRFHTRSGNGRLDMSYSSDILEHNELDYDQQYRYPSGPEYLQGSYGNSLNGTSPAHSANFHNHPSHSAYRRNHYLSSIQQPGNRATSLLYTPGEQHHFRPQLPTAASSLPEYQLRQQLTGSQLKDYHSPATISSPNGCNSTQRQPKSYHQTSVSPQGSRGRAVTRTDITNNASTNNLTTSKERVTEGNEDMTKEEMDQLEIALRESAAAAEEQQRSKASYSIVQQLDSAKSGHLTSEEIEQIENALLDTSMRADIIESEVNISTPGNADKKNSSILGGVHNNDYYNSEDDAESNFDAVDIAKKNRENSFDQSLYDDDESIALLPLADASQGDDSDVDEQSEAGVIFLDDNMTNHTSKNTSSPVKNVPKVINERFTGAQLKRINLSLFNRASSHKKLQIFDDDDDDDEEEFEDDGEMFEESCSTVDASHYTEEIIPPACDKSHQNTKFDASDDKKQKQKHNDIKEWEYEDNDEQFEEDEEESLGSSSISGSGRREVISSERRTRKRFGIEANMKTTTGSVASSQSGQATLFSQELTADSEETTCYRGQTAHYPQEVTRYEKELHDGIDPSKRIPDTFQQDAGVNTGIVISAGLDIGVAGNNKDSESNRRMSKSEKQSGDKAIRLSLNWNTEKCTASSSGTRTVPVPVPVRSIVASRGGVPQLPSMGRKTFMSMMSSMKFNKSSSDFQFENISKSNEELGGNIVENDSVITAPTGTDQEANSSSTSGTEDNKANLNSTIVKDTILRAYIDNAINAGLITRCTGMVKKGKGSEIYHAITSAKKIRSTMESTDVNGTGGVCYYDSAVAIKVFDLGDSLYWKTSFRNLQNQEQMNMWATKEYKHLKRAQKAGVPVPAPLAQVDNIVYMQFLGKGGISAPRLKDVELRRGHKKLRKLFWQVMDAVQCLYANALLVHGSLNEFNILVAPACLVRHDPRMNAVTGDTSEVKSDNATTALSNSASSEPLSPSKSIVDEVEVVLIDFRQCIDIRHPDADFMLKADLQRIRSYFSKHAGVRTLSVNEMIEYVTRKSKAT